MIKGDYFTSNCIFGTRLILLQLIGTESNYMCMYHLQVFCKQPNALLCTGVRMDNATYPDPNFKQLNRQQLKTSLIKAQIIAGCLRYIRMYLHTYLHTYHTYNTLLAMHTQKELKVPDNVRKQKSPVKQESISKKGKHIKVTN